MEIIDYEEIVEFIQNKMTIMIGGFMSVGAPLSIIDQLITNDNKELTIIANDTGSPNCGISKLVANGQVRKVLASHIGTNPETGQQMIREELEVQLIPQGTLAEQIHAAGAGLGGFLTPTGVGTLVEEGKEKLTLNGKEYLIEQPLQADVAIIKAQKADKRGNLIYAKSARNFNPLMAMAADLVIAEVDEIVEIGELNPDEIVTPFILVDYVVLSRGGSDLDERK